jgi:DNA-binding CsgD family transcriptional regulator
VDIGGGDREQALDVLERLLALEAVDLESAFQHAAQGVAEALQADKVDVFVREGDWLVALGTSDTPMGRREREVGLDRLPVGRAGLLGWSIENGQSFVSPNLADDPRELPEVHRLLGAQSAMAAPLWVGGTVVGAVLVTSAEAEAFEAAELRFLESVARWIGLVGHRAALVEELTSKAAEDGLRVGSEAVLEQLTPRQRDVASLVAQGLTNAEIAHQLMVSRGTVANHVQDIIRRLGVRRRAQLAAWFAERERPEAVRHES